MSFFTNIFGTKATSEEINILDKTAFSEAISGKKVQLVDVRTANEFNNGHIKNAINIDYFNGSKFLQAFEKLDKNKPIYLYCRSGARSQKAANKIIGIGFTEIYDLKGGFMKWL